MGQALRQTNVCDCSDIDDIIVIRKDGTYLITKVADKQFVGKDVIHVDGVELPIEQFHLDRQGLALMLGNAKTVVHHLSCARRDLVIVEGREDVLGIAAVDPVAVRGGPWPRPKS